MTSLRFGRETYYYMANIVDEKKANELDSVSVASCYCFLLKETVFHKQVGLPPAFDFVVFVVTVNNFDLAIMKYSTNCYLYKFFSNWMNLFISCKLTAFFAMITVLFIIC